MTTEKVVSIIAALATLVGVVTNLVIAIRTKQQTTTIRADVNHNLTLMTERVEQLTTLLAEGGHEIPGTPPVRAP